MPVLFLVPQVFFVLSWLLISECYSILYFQYYCANVRPVSCA